MTERLSFDAIDGLRARLVLREAQSESTRPRPPAWWFAALGFFGSVTVVLTLALAVSAPHHRAPILQELGLRSTIPE